MGGRGWTGKDGIGSSPRTVDSGQARLYSPNERSQIDAPDISHQTGILVRSDSQEKHRGARPVCSTQHARVAGQCPSCVVSQQAQVCLHGPSQQAGAANGRGHPIASTRGRWSRHEGLDACCRQHVKQDGVQGRGRRCHRCASLS